jgi:nucleoside-diphosphate-sugar epimerase
VSSAGVAEAQDRVAMFPTHIAQALRQSDLHIVVTGAGGWLGSVSAHMLADVFGGQFGSRVFLYGSCARELTLIDGRRLACAALADLEHLPDGRYLFLHYAFLTKDRVPQMTLAEYRQANGVIAATVDAAIRRVQTVGVFVPSSGAVYRADRSLETDFEANPYGAGKYADERHFTAVAADVGCRLALVRVFNLAGPYINKVASYALASILMDILRGLPVSLRARQPVIRSYVHVQDLVALAMAVLLDESGKTPPVFDTAGELELEVEALAHRAVQVLQRQDLPILRPALTTAMANRYVGDPARMIELAQRYRLRLAPIDKQILDTAQYLRKLFQTRATPAL